MQHRQPRLGDIVDDYCPRERRLTNHAVVAMVGPDIKQTRCTTCDTEHEYKHAKVPSVRKKKESAPALFKQVLASAQPEGVRAADAAEPEPPAQPVEPPVAQAETTPPPPVAEPEPAPPAVASPPSAGSAPAETPAETGDEQPLAEGDDEGPVHRRLIRATLPRPEGGVPTPRPVPQFTVRQPNKFGNANTRGGGRPGGGGGQGGGRQRNQSGRGGFARNTSSREAFTGRSSGNPHHPSQRPHPQHRHTGRPLRHGKKTK